MIEPVRVGLERAVETEPDYAEALACLSLVYSNAFRFRHPIGDPDPDPRGRALALARRAVDLAPNSSWARYALGLARWFAGDRRGGPDGAGGRPRAQPQRHDDPRRPRPALCDARPLGRRGAAARGVLFRQPGQPGSYRIGLFLYHYAHGRYAEALAEARRVDAPQVLYGHVAVAAAAAELGLDGQAAEAVAAIRRLDPDYGRHVVADLEVRHVAPALVTLIVDGLEKAGIPVTDTRASRHELAVHRAPGVDPPGSHPRGFRRSLTMAPGETLPLRAVLASLKGYRPGWVKADVAAGLAIAAVGLPSAIAYPAIAGLPPQTGLYASIAPLVAYAIFGPSRQLVVGPDAATITVMAAVLAAMPGLPAADRPAVAALLALVVGGFYLGARLLGLGVLSTFLSRPILVGFFAGISLSILVGQLGRITGVSLDAEGLLPPLARAGRQRGADPLAVARARRSACSACSQARPRHPAAGPRPGRRGGARRRALGAPRLSRPRHRRRRRHPVGPAAARPAGHRRRRPRRILIGAAAIFLVSFAAGIVTARSFGERGGYPVDADREMVGFGAANIAAGLFSAFPITASDSRTAINASVGGRSQVASVVAAATLVAIVLFLQPALAILPIPALGAILIAAALSLIDIPALREIWRISRMEFVFAMIALFAPISLGVLNGVLVAIGATFAYLLHKMMYPRDALLGRVSGRDGFYKLHRHPEARPVPGPRPSRSSRATCCSSIPTMCRAGCTPWPTPCRRAPAGSSSTPAPSPRSTRPPPPCSRRSAPTSPPAASPSASPSCTPTSRGLLDRAGLLAAIGPDMIFDDLDDALRAFEATSPKGGSPMTKKHKKAKEAEAPAEHPPPPTRRRPAPRPTRRSSPGCRWRSPTCRPG